MRGWALVAVVVAGSGGVAVAGRPVPDAPPAPAPAAVAPSGTGDVERLTPGLRRAVERATATASRDGDELRVTSGWRSARHQARLHAEAVGKYGSAAAARQWVLPPDESEHVRGGVDVGPPEAATWLDEHGVRFGLCRRYDNEPRHVERLAPAVGSRCPAREPHA